MKKLFGKNSLSVSSHSPAIPSNRAQLTWSLFVAIAVAIVALQQVKAIQREHTRAPAAQSSTPKTLVTGKPVPLSQEDLNEPETESALQ